MRLRWRRHFSFLISLWRWFVLIFFVISVYFVLHLSTERSSADLEQEISRLSVYYVRALAREKKLHPAASIDVVDLQKTMSVLLHTMLQRMSNIESALSRNLSRDSSMRDLHNSVPRSASSSRSIGDSSSASSSSAASSDSLSYPSLSSSLSQPSQIEERRLFKAFINFNRMKNLMSRVGTKCDLPSDWPASYPECEGKLEWIAQYYTTHACYAFYGVDGSHCSGLIYLSEVENFCPRSPSVSIRPIARLKRDLAVLPILLGTAPSPVVSRVQQAWPAWRDAGRLREAAAAKSNSSSLRIALMPLGIGQAADREMVMMMWADLAAALHRLGHDLVWVQSTDRLKALMQRFPGQGESAKSPCQASVTLFVDLIFTDPRGVEELEKGLGQAYSRVSCVLRVVRETGLIPTMEIPPNHLRWRQFLTPYPTFDDHTFLGFALAKNSAPRPASERRFALVLGSHPDHFRDAGPYLAAVADNFPLHTLLNSAAERSAVARLLSPHVPEFTNHRITEDRVERLTSLLSSAAVVVGLGKPFDPALALMAIAEGAVFLNPHFDRPRYVLHNATQPSLYEDDWRVTSQHSYLERFVHEPYVLQVPIDQPSELSALLKRATDLVTKVTPHVPYAFSHAGYLERLAFLLRTQDFCSPNLTPLEPIWPPASAVEFYLSVKGDSCERTCARKDRVCEPAYFPVINSRVELQERSIECESSYFQPNPAFPAYAPAQKICHFQSDPQRYSCYRTPASSKLLRICPCRDHRPGLYSLCKDCR